MSRLVSAFAPLLDPPAAADRLAQAIESALGGPEQIAGGFLFATAAAGGSAIELGRILGRRWPAAELLGTSFEGVLGEGRVWLAEPAVVLLAWKAGGGAPTPLLVPDDGRAPDERAAELLETLEMLGMSGGHGHGRDDGQVQLLDHPHERVDADDLVLLFPDADAGGLLEACLAASDERGPHGPLFVGATATGVDGERSRSWAFRPGSATGHEPAAGEALALVGLWLPGRLVTGAGPLRPRARLISATRQASPWLEITACRPRWIDALEGESPAIWIRRQLGLADTSPLDSLLDRLLVRVASARNSNGDGDFEECDPVLYEERYAAGLDARRGAIGWLGRFARFDRAALALSDPALARDGLRAAVAELAPARLLFQVGCTSRGASLHGDPDLESALVASELAGSSRQAIGVVGPNQLIAGHGRLARLLVHSTILAALDHPPSDFDPDPDPDRDFLVPIIEPSI